ncbi:MAG TPA: DMT family transporter [Burkholderiaceae bacterium]|nr:DMT family transporter [Burkholderiaceae bacterium]
MSGRASLAFSAYLPLTASMSLVGVYVALSKPLVAVLPVFALAFLRFGIAAVAMLPFTRRGPAEAPLSAVEHRLLFVQSFFGNFLFSICLLNGMARTTATAAGVVLSTLPAVVALLSRLVLREKLSRRVIAAIVLAVGGITLLQFARTDDAASAATSWLGNLLILGAVFCEATYVIVGKRLAATRTPLRVSALINLWGLVLIAPFGLWQLQQIDLGALSASTWGLLVFYSIAASLVAVWLWMTGLKHIPANQAGVFTVALPIAAALIGVVALGESFTPLHAAALLLAASGVVLIATARVDAVAAPI